MSVERAVKPKDDVEIIFTDKCKFKKEGSSSFVHSVQAEKLIAAGKAVLAKDASKVPAKDADNTEEKGGKK